MKKVLQILIFIVMLGWMAASQGWAQSTVTTDEL